MTHMSFPPDESGPKCVSVQPAFLYDKLVLLGALGICGYDSTSPTLIYCLYQMGLREQVQHKGRLECVFTVTATWQDHTEKQLRDKLKQNCLCLWKHVALAKSNKRQHNKRAKASTQLFAKPLQKHLMPSGVHPAQDLQSPAKLFEQ